MGTGGPNQYKLHRSLQSNALQICVCFSYNPKVLRTNVIPGKHSGVHRKYMTPV